MTIQGKREQVLSRATELAESAASPLGLCVLDVRLTQQGHRASLEVCILRKGGSISLQDCEHVSRELDKLMEEAARSGPLLAGSFFLEVVSPGIDRQLTSRREFEIFAGEKVRVKAKENIEEWGADFICTLVGGDDSTVLVKDGKVYVDPSRKKSNMGKAKRQERVNSGGVVKLNLSKVYKINLYSEDLKNVG